ncbi:MAG TPA: hypothetical protein VKK31_31770 [Thermoanaerobaculia bacterium]|nr:hypothetical protein [Thermoanaerobaculia bacterium]
MNKELKAAATATETQAKSEDKTPDGSCCTAPPDDDPGPIKP